MPEANTQTMAVDMDAKGAAVANAVAGTIAAQSQPSSIEGHMAWPMISRLPVMVAVNVPLTGLTVRNLLQLRCGETIASAWATTEDVPLKADALQLFWGEFEVVEQRMALRLTRLA
jgi:flagellar motor switch protein FliN/FliY